MMSKNLVASLCGALLVGGVAAGWYVYQNPCQCSQYLCERHEQAAGRLQDQQNPHYLGFQPTWLNQPAKILYPSYAYNKKIEGSVVLALVVSAEGKLVSKSIKTSSGVAMLDEAALAAADTFDFNVAAFGAVEFPFTKELKVTFKKESV